MKGVLCSHFTGNLPCSSYRQNWHHRICLAEMLPVGSVRGTLGDHTTKL